MSGLNRIHQTSGLHWNSPPMELRLKVDPGHGIADAHAWISHTWMSHAHGQHDEPPRKTKKKRRSICTFFVAETRPQIQELSHRLSNPKSRYTGADLVHRLLDRLLRSYRAVGVDDVDGEDVGPADDGDVLAVDVDEPVDVLEERSMEGRGR